MSQWRQGATSAFLTISGFSFVGEVLVQLASYLSDDIHHQHSLRKHPYHHTSHPRILRVFRSAFPLPSSPSNPTRHVPTRSTRTEECVPSPHQIPHALKPSIPSHSPSLNPRPCTRADTRARIHGPPTLPPPPRRPRALRRTPRLRPVPQPRHG